MELRALAAVPNVNTGSDQRSGYDANRTMIPADRALVHLPVAAADSASRGFSSSAAQRYGDAAFITHLIATAHGVPQTRSRRRAEPDCAISAYAAVSRNALRAGHAIGESR
jgi:hypothetical protein